MTDDPKKAVDDAVQLLRNESRAVDEVPTLEIRPRSGRRRRGESEAPRRRLSEISGRIAFAETATPFAIVDGYGTMTFATPSASVFLGGSASTMLVGRTLDRFIGPVDSDQGAAFATILENVEDEAIVVSCSRRDGDDEDRFTATIERIRSVLRIDSFAISFAAIRMPTARQAETSELATATAVAEIGIALVDEATFEGFLRRSAKAIREATEVDGLRILTKLGRSGTDAAGRDSVVVDREPSSPPVGSHLLASRRLDLPLCAIEVLGAEPTERAITILERAGRRLSSAIAKRWAEDRLVSLASQFTLLDAISNDLCGPRNSPLELLGSVARQLGLRPESGCIIELDAESPGAAERVAIESARHDLRGALGAYADERTSHEASGRPGPRPDLHAVLRQRGVDPVAILSVPVRHVGKKLGTIHVVHLGRLPTDGRADEMFVQAIGDRLGLAIVGSTGPSTQGAAR